MVEIPALNERCELDPVLHNLFFATIYNGLALWAACVFFAAVLPRSLALRRVFLAIARPPSRIVAAMTPAIIPVFMHPLLTVFWLLTLRVVFYLVMAAYGLLPRVGAL